MAIYSILCEVKDVGEADIGICEFNDFLEDYLSIIETVEGEEDDYAILPQLSGKDHNLKICVNLELNINKDAIANQTIRCGDPFKLSKGIIKYLYVVCGSFDEYQKVIILTLGDKEEYVMAKALYYTMSESENEYEGTRNETIALSVNKESVDALLGTVESLFERGRKAGIVQRGLGAELFLDHDEMYELVQEIASYQLVNLRDILAKCDDKEGCINNIIVNRFLLKRFSYMQYMTDKDNLNKVHKGNVKKRRQVTREKCDTIGFVSCSEPWKLVKELRQEAERFLSSACQT